MRSVFVLLHETTETEVEKHLQQAYPARLGPPWLMSKDGDTRLWIDFCRDGPFEHEPDDWARIIEHFDGEPIALVADVTGRHPGDAEVSEFITGVLNHFSGAAMDEYTLHLWSLADLKNNRIVEGHSFFDYIGWEEEDQRRVSNSS